MKQADKNNSRDHINATGLETDPILTIPAVQATPYTRRGGRIDKKLAKEKMKGQLDLNKTQLILGGSKVRSPVALSLSPEIRDNHSKITSTMLASFSSRDSNNLNGMGFSDPQLLVNNDLIKEFANTAFTPVLGNSTPQHSEDHFP